MRTIDQAYAKAIDVLKHCVRPAGFFASGLPGGYEALWARDSMITSLGASIVDEETNGRLKQGGIINDLFKEAFSRSIATLAKNQAEAGQIPNCVGSYNIDRRSDVTFNSVDSSLWFIIGNYAYARRYKDQNHLKKYRLNILKALWWLKAQDPDNVGLLAQQPTNDWQDAFPHKYGYTIHGNALYYAALKITGQTKSAENLKKTINGEIRKYCALYDDKLGYYYPWAWKNHDAIREHEEWFDTAGNLLAIITGLATPPIAKSILHYVEKEKINLPYPCKAIWPPIKKGDKEWHDYFALCDARQPFKYSNAGIWPFIGAWYVAALVKAGEMKKAETQLEKLAAANSQVINQPRFPQYMYEVSKNKHIPLKELVGMRKKEFNEWLDGKTGKPLGEPYQAWSAGTFIYACECVKQRRVLFFLK